jgi:hypothetical protein
VLATTAVGVQQVSFVDASVYTKDVCKASFLFTSPDFVWQWVWKEGVFRVLLGENVLLLSLV